jgi:hypothetical protein
MCCPGHHSDFGVFKTAWSSAGTESNGYTDGAIMKVELASGAVTPLATGRVYPRAVALDANNIYWVEQGTGNWGNVVGLTDVSGTQLRAQAWVPAGHAHSPPGQAHQSAASTKPFTQKSKLAASPGIANWMLMIGCRA